jgi:hypothetical protein
MSRRSADDYGRWGAVAPLVCSVLEWLVPLPSVVSSSALWLNLVLRVVTSFTVCVWDNETCRLPPRWSFAPVMRSG